MMMCSSLTRRTGMLKNARSYYTRWICIVSFVGGGLAETLTGSRVVGAWLHAFRLRQSYVGGFAGCETGAPC